MVVHISKNISEKEIEEFQEIHSRLTGNRISKTVAEKEILNMLAFIASVLKDSR